MEIAKNKLFEAFRDDHTLLGRGFHEISAALRASDIAGAREMAERVNREAGPHIAFEEKHFYPLLETLLGQDDVARLYEEHDEGLTVLRELTSDGRRGLAEKRRLSLLRASEAMESHIAECGELFEAIGRIPEGEQAALYEHLVRIRREAPKWLDFAERKDAGPGKGDSQ